MKRCVGGGGPTTAAASTAATASASMATTSAVSDLEGRPGTGGCTLASPAACAPQGPVDRDRLGESHREEKGNDAGHVQACYAKRLRRAGLRRPAEGARDARAHHVSSPEGHPGRQGRDRSP